MLRALEEILLNFNTRIRLSMNTDIGRVVIKVVDAKSDKIIREIPPPEVQRLLARLKEAIGLFIDMTI